MLLDVRHTHMDGFEYGDFFCLRNCSGYRSLETLPMSTNIRRLEEIIHSAKGMVVSWTRFHIA